MIRAAERGDVPGIARLLVEVQNQHAAQYPTIFRPMSSDEALAVVEQGVSPGRYVVAVPKDAVVGFATWSVHQRAESPFTWRSVFVEVEQICVDSACRRQHVARDLFDWLAARAREVGASRLQLNHWAANSLAAAAFGRCGFIAYNHRMWRWL